MIGSEVIRGFIDSIILEILSEGDNYGYQIAYEIEKRTKGTYLLKEATLYASFKRLETKGYLESYSGEITHGRKRKYYHLTPIGKTYLIEKINEWRHTKSIIDLFLGRDLND